MKTSKTTINNSTPFLLEGIGKHIAFLFKDVRLLLTSILIILISSNSFGQSEVYYIDATGLMKTLGACDKAQQAFSTNENPSFSWNDKLPLGVTIDAVTIEFNLGIECEAKMVRSVGLNSVPFDKVATREFCNCVQIEDYLITVNADPSLYLLGENNVFTLFASANKGTQIGYSVNNKVLKGHFARVTVEYSSTDLELLSVKPVTNFSSLCMLSEYDIDVTIKNNGPGKTGEVDVLIEYPGAENLKGKVDASDLNPGQTKTYRLISDKKFYPETLGDNLNIVGTLLYSDMNEKNNASISILSVLSTPYGAEIKPFTSKYPGFSKLGIKTDPDLITYNKTYRYDITPPVKYSNLSYANDWSATFEMFINNQKVSSNYVYTAPTGSNNAFVEFSLDEKYLDADIQLRFVVTDISGNGCDSTSTRYAVVMPTPKPLYEGITVCEIDELQFINKSSIASGLNSYRWDFGDGNGSTLFEPKHKFGAVGSYPVKLVATSDIGFADSLTIIIEVYPSPIVDFSFTNQCGNNAIPFVNSSTITTGALSYFWEFGDGTESQLQSPNKTYSVAGPYNVVLIAESDKGCFNSVTKSVYSYPTPNVDFKVPSVVCAGDNITIQNTTSIEFSTWGSEWTIGNSNYKTFTKNPLYMFKQFGDQEIGLKVTTQYGCVDSIVKNITINPGPVIDITYSDVCSNGPVTFNSGIIVTQGTQVEYVWNIEGILSTASNPTISFGSSGTKNVSVDIIYANGCRNKASTQVLTGYRPDVSFSTPDVVCSGLAISLSNNTTIEFGKATHTWIMGDGSVYNDVIVPNHIYTNTTPVNYTITLISSSSNGICPDTVSQSITVGIVPVCDFDIIPTYVNGHRGYTFTPSQTSSNYQWYFGDGRTSTQESPLYQYQRDGNFPVRLVVTSDEGCQCEKVINNLVVNSSANNILAETGISIYPNPSTGLVYVSNEGNTQIKSIKVMNTVGTVILDKTISSQMSEYIVDLSNVSTGIYMVTIETMDGQQFVHRVIIAK